VEAAQEYLKTRLNREPVDAELAEECGLDAPVVRRLRATPPPSFVALESPWPGNETELTLAEAIPDETSAGPDHEAALHSDRNLVERLLPALSPAEQQVIRLRYGLDDGGHRSLGEVGQLLGYSRQGIHRLESVALAKLRQRARFLQAAPTSDGQRAKVEGRRSKAAKVLNQEESPMTSGLLRASDFGPRPSTRPSTSRDRCRRTALPQAA